MGTLVSATTYHYWSERMVDQRLQDTTAKGNAIWGSQLGIGPLTLTVQSAPPENNRAARTQRLSLLLADLTITDLAYGGPCEFVSGTSDVVLGSLRNTHGEDVGALYLFSEAVGARGERIAICLFGSPHNVVGFTPEVPAWRRFGWTSSTNHGVAALMHAASGAVDADDPHSVWRAHQVQLSEQTGRELCWNALNICVGQGEHLGSKDAPWRRGYTIGAFVNAQWFAHVYYTAEDVWLLGQNFDFVHVGAPYWVRTGDPSAWMPYTRETATSLDARFRDGARWRQQRSLAGRLWRRLKDRHVRIPRDPST